MKKSEFKTSFYTLMDEQVECMGLEDKIVFIRKILVDYQKEREDFLDTSNKGKGWSDEQLGAHSFPCAYEGELRLAGTHI